MKTNLNNWLKETPYLYDYSKVRGELVCNDGTTLSVQASQSHFCSPRFKDSISYSEVEVYFVSSDVPKCWLEYGDNDGIYNPFAYIPVVMVEEFIDSHGGIKND
jgi:hypothetical protein